ncbi:hypothetical protein BV494_21875 (plasmid) [Rahnella sikkimica]|uniref:HEAT repeat domain-containing protein n=2 Tax=Rahnella sikkimica TaxID=1805933 RepID=A0A2L1UXA1_9GAMM|nr:hypothetical protein BV494_21875 [Rahnella sikkimica]
MDRLHSANSEELTLLLLGLTELDDWPWVQDVYLKFINDKNIWIASAAISGLGDLARIHRQIGKEHVVKALTDLASSRKELIGKIGDALDDIAIFT